MSTERKMASLRDAKRRNPREDPQAGRRAPHGGPLAQRERVGKETTKEAGDSLSPLRGLHAT